FLEFNDGLAVELIFMGLATMLAIGPLFYLFAKSCSLRDFSLRRKHLVHFIPSVLGLVFGLWLNQTLSETLPKLLFAAIFLGYYAQFLTYLIISLRFIRAQEKAGLASGIVSFLKLLVYSLFAIWVVYFLNLIDEVVPYIFGPILYSIVAYVVSFIVISKGYLEKIHRKKYRTTSVPEEKTSQLYDSLIRLMEKEKEFKNPEISLKSLSQALNVTPQVLSMTINQTTGKNFNAFVNRYRVEEAAQLLSDDKYKGYTISAIAYEVGFNSISSFNTNFKNQIGKTPAAYLKQL
ncbi:MAG: helix-turn-helix domain-containing protein, partial [Cyclobacteriaceae bacterium]